MSHLPLQRSRKGTLGGDRGSAAGPREWGLWVRGVGGWILRIVHAAPFVTPVRCRAPTGRHGTGSVSGARITRPRPRQPEDCRIWVGPVGFTDTCAARGIHPGGEWQRWPVPHRKWGDHGAARGYAPSSQNVIKQTKHLVRRWPGAHGVAPTRTLTLRCGTTFVVSTGVCRPGGPVGAVHARVRAEAVRTCAGVDLY